MSAPCSVFLESRHKDRGLPNSRHRTPDIEQHRHDPEVPNNMIKYTVEHPEGSPEGGDRTPSGSEDLFLSLAKDNRPRSDTEEELKRRERRKSIGTSASRRGQGEEKSYSSPLTPASSMSPGNVAEQYLEAARKERQQHAQSRRSSQQPSPAANYHVPRRERASDTLASILDRGQPRHNGQIPKSSFLSLGVNGLEKQVNPLYYARHRPSFPDSYQTPPNRSPYYRPSNLAYSTSRHYDSTPALDTPPGSTTNGFCGLSPTDGGTDSAGSMTAASTVWDELDELKSRIHKLELTGKLPSTSSAAMAQVVAERPRTSSTTLTIISSSPRAHRKPSAPPTEVPVGPAKAANLHPLLHQALRRAKPLLNADLYRPLEATAADALTLAVMSGSSASDGTTYMSASPMQSPAAADRQTRRRADNLCRSLTELCIALCEGKHNTTPVVRTKPAASATDAQRSLISDGHTGLPHHRQLSIEPEETGVLRSPSRALSRIEARRVSLHTLNQSRSTTASPRENAHESIPQSRPPPSERVERTATSRLNGASRYQEDAHGSSNDQSFRAPSRARTEIGNARTVSRDAGRFRRISREYISQVPLPTQTYQFGSSEGLGTPFAVREETNGVTGVVNGGAYSRDVEEMRFLDGGTSEDRAYGSGSVVRGRTAYLGTR